MARVSVIGVGNMGLGIALRLVDGGHAVTVRDLDPAREALARDGGCTVAPSAAAAARGCELLVVVVVNAAQTHELLFAATAQGGVADALPAGASVMLCPTLAPADVEACAQALAERGIGCLDAPMSGGPLRAREGRMSLMVAAPQALLERWLPLLQHMADPVFPVGTRAGDGARTKLVNNLLAAINLAGAAEALALADRLGLDARRTLQVIEASSGQSWIGSDRLQRALAGDASVHAHMTLLAKDSTLAMREAQACAADCAVGEAAARRFQQALQAGLSDQDDGALYAWLRQARRD